MLITFGMTEVIRLSSLRRQDQIPSTPCAVSSDVFSIGKYIFQGNRQILAVNKEEKKLSFRESQLLKILCENREKIIDRKDILNLLWGSDSFFNSRNLDVYITKLRSYLKEDPSIEIITIKGIGYRFVAS